MDSVRYSEIIVRVQQRLMRIAEGAEAAADGDIEGEERDAAIVAARAKLAEYEEALMEIRAESSVLAAGFEQELKMHVQLLRESLARL